ncbi:MAG: hypothetical protein WCT05_12600 [Lentisphaeria bacterium]
MYTPEVLLKAVEGRRPNAAIFLSGGGSNAEQILRRNQEVLSQGKEVPYDLRVLVTDAPDTSRARELGATYGIAVVEEDIRAFYRANGEERVSIRTLRAQELRDQWSDLLRQKLRPYAIDFAVFAGFVPLTNLTADFPCLNVHPGDLTYLKDGRRYLVGLHQRPVELAILEGHQTLRSSVILALPYTGQGDDMDNGPILGISPEVTVELQGEKLAGLQAMAAARPSKRPAAGFGDRLAELANFNLERLKRGGDWQVLPGVVRDFAKGSYALAENKYLFYRIGKKFHPVETVLVDGDKREALFAGQAL